jgi:hypothetical protein
VYSHVRVFFNSFWDYEDAKKTLFRFNDQYIKYATKVVSKKNKIEEMLYVNGTECINF